MNKQECLELLNKIEAEISKHEWQAQVDDLTYMLDHHDLKPYLEDFALPEAEFSRNFCVRLPEGWMEDVDGESQDYCEVLEKYEDVYHFLRSEASREDEALSLEAARDERDMHREYIRLVSGR